jgi:hypothetical protein
MSDRGASDFLPVSIPLVEAHGSFQRWFGAVVVAAAAGIFALAFAIGPIDGWLGAGVARIFAVLVIAIGGAGLIPLWRGLAIWWALRADVESIELYVTQAKFVMKRTNGVMVTAPAGGFDEVEAAKLVTPPEARVVRRD